MIKPNEDKMKELDNIAYALPPATLELLVTFARGMQAGMREKRPVRQNGLSSSGQETDGKPAA